MDYYEETTTYDPIWLRQNTGNTALEYMVKGQRVFHNDCMLNKELEVVTKMTKHQSHFKRTSTIYDNFGVETLGQRAKFNKIAHFFFTFR